MINKNAHVCRHAVDGDKGWMCSCYKKIYCKAQEHIYSDKGALVGAMCSYVTEAVGNKPEGLED